MIPIQFVYTENGERKSSLDEHRRRVEILEHNKRLNEQYPVYVNQDKKTMDDKMAFCYSICPC